MYMVDTIDAAAACPLVKIDNIFGIIVTISSIMIQFYFI